MEASKVETTHTQANGSTEPAEPRSDTPLADEIDEAIAATRRSLGYLARNMTAAFDGNLTNIEANAHCGLVEAFGHLTTIEEVCSRVHWFEDRHRTASGKPAPATAPNGLEVHAEHIAEALDDLEAALAQAECTTSAKGTRAIHRAQKAAANIRHSVALMRADEGEEVPS